MDWSGGCSKWPRYRRKGCTGRYVLEGWKGNKKWKWRWRRSGVSVPWSEAGKQCTAARSCQIWDMSTGRRSANQGETGMRDSHDWHEVSPRWCMSTLARLWGQQCFPSTVTFCELHTADSRATDFNAPTLCPKNFSLPSLPPVYNNLLDSSLDDFKNFVVPRPDSATNLKG